MSKNLNNMFANFTSQLERLTIADIRAIREDAELKKSVEGFRAAVGAMGRQLATSEEAKS